MKSPDNTRAGALAYESVLRRKLARGEPLEEPQKVAVPTFAAFVEEWFSTHVMTNNKPSTQRSTRSLIDGHFKEAFGRKRLDEICVDDVERFKAAKLQAGLSPKTVNNHIGVIAKCLHAAVDWGRLASAPRIKMLKVPPQRFDFLTPAESARLIDAFGDAQWRAMATCAVRAGLRMGELLGLRWEDVDLERGTLTVRHSIVCGIVGTPKSNKIRYIPLTQDLADALEELAPKTGYVFRQPNGEPMTRGMIWRALLTACKRSGTRPIGWHVLRHTFASQLASEGIAIHTIQALLGHSDVKMTMRYAHLMPSTLRSAVDVLDAAMRRETGKVRQPAGNRTPEEPEMTTENEALIRTLLR